MKDDEKPEGTGTAARHAGPGHRLAGDVGWKGLEGEGDRHVIHAEIVGQFLQFAVTALRAEHAIVIPLGKKKFQDRPSTFLDPIIGGHNGHSVSNGCRTACGEFRRAVHLDDAKAASAPI